MAKNLLQNSCELVTTTPTAGTAAIANPFGLNLLQTQTSAGGTTFTFINLAQYPYTNYAIFLNFTCSSATNATHLLRLSTNNGSSYITTGYTASNAYITSGGTTITAGTAANVMFIGNNTAGAAGGITTGWCWLSNLNVASPSLLCALNSLTNSNGGICWCASTYNTLVTANAFQVFANAGTYTGSIKLYGVS